MRRPKFPVPCRPCRRICWPRLTRREPREILDDEESAKQRSRLRRRQLVGEQISLQGKVAGTIEIASSGGGLGLIHELADLSHHFLLSRTELLAFGFFQLILSGREQLLRRVALMRAALGAAATLELHRGLRGSAIPHHGLSGRAPAGRLGRIGGSR